MRAILWNTHQIIENLINMKITTSQHQMLTNTLNHYKDALIHIEDCNTPAQVEYFLRNNNMAYGICYYVRHYFDCSSHYFINEILIESQYLTTNQMYICETPRQLDFDKEDSKKSMQIRIDVLTEIFSSNNLEISS